MAAFKFGWLLAIFQVISGVCNYFNKTPEIECGNSGWSRMQTTSVHSRIQYFLWKQSHRALIDRSERAVWLLSPPWKNGVYGQEQRILSFVSNVHSERSKVRYFTLKTRSHPLIYHSYVQSAVFKETQLFRFTPVRVQKHHCAVAPVQRTNNVANNEEYNHTPQ